MFKVKSHPRVRQRLVPVTVAAFAVALGPAVASATAQRPGADLAAVPTATVMAPAPPTVAGCYRLVDKAWQGTACATPGYIAQHIPHPEVLAGVGASQTATPAAPPFTLGVVDTSLMAGGGDTDSKYGAGHFSIQDNVFFVGSNGDNDGVQFTDQTGGPIDNLCVWQVDIVTQTYTPVCLPIVAAGRADGVEGWVQQPPDGSTAPALLGVALTTTQGPVGLVLAFDTYGVGSDHRWDNNSGSILGYGNGSQAVFSSAEERISVVGSACLDAAGFLGFITPCTSPTLKPNGYVGFSPGPLTLNDLTVESNNLIPVIGSPPAHLPPITYPNPYTAKITYVASTTGACFAGTPPNCL